MAFSYRPSAFGKRTGERAGNGMCFPSGDELRNHYQSTH